MGFLYLKFFLTQKTFILILNNSRVAFLNNQLNNGSSFSPSDSSKFFSHSQKFPQTIRPRESMKVHNS